MDEGTITLLHGISSYANILFELGVAVAAFARLRATPAGLLIGIGFSTLMAMSLVSRLMWTLGMPSPDDLDSGATIEHLLLISNGIGLCSSVVVVVVGVGTLLIPSSLGKREQAAGG